MQIVNVTDIKMKTGVTKTGTKAGDPWELIIIIGDDGSEFTTFDKAAKEVGIGGIIELEPVIKAGKTNFTKFTIKKKGQAPVPSVTTSSEETPVKRQSIEDQNRAGHITNLWIAGKIKDDDSLVKKLRTWLDKIGTPVAEKKVDAAPEKDEKKTTKPPPEGNGAPPLKNVGELFARAAKYGISTRDVCEAVGVGKRDDITDLDVAWKATATKFAGTIKAAKEGVNT